MRKSPVDAIILKLDDLRAVSLRNTITLEEHVRRTELIERSVEKVVADIIPIKAHVAMWGGAGKILTAGASLTAIAYGILQLLKHI